MRVVVTSQGRDLDSFVDPRFGRCAYFLFIDSETMKVEAHANEARQAPGGAGIQAARFVVDKEAQAVITGSVGPNAEEVLKKSSIPAYHGAGTISGVIEKLKAGTLSPVGSRD